MVYLVPGQREAKVPEEDYFYLRTIEYKNPLYIYKCQICLKTKSFIDRPVQI